MKLTCEYTFPPISYKERMSWYNRNFSVNLLWPILKYLTVTTFCILCVCELFIDKSNVSLFALIMGLILSFITYLVPFLLSIREKKAEFRIERINLLYDYIYGIKIDNGFIQLQYTDKNDRHYNVALPIHEYSIKVRKEDVNKMKGKKKFDYPIYTLCIFKDSDNIKILDEKFTLEDQNAFGHVSDRVSEIVSYLESKYEKKIGMSNISKKIGLELIKSKSPFYFQISEMKWNEKIFKDIYQVWMNVRNFED